MSPNQRRSTDEPTTELRDADCYVLGGGDLGRSIARQLREKGCDAAVVDDDHGATDVPGLQADPADPDALERAAVTGASTIVVAARTDKRAFLIAQRVRTRFDAPRVLVLTAVRDRVAAFAAAGHEPICATSALTDAVVDAV